MKDRISARLGWLALLMLGLTVAAHSGRAPVKIKDSKTIGFGAAAPAPKGGEHTGRWALLVGVGKYTDPAISSIPFCIQDTHDLEQTLREMGYDVVRLCDDVPDETLKPTKSNVLVQAQRMLLKDERMQPEHTVLIYFSGHGFASPNGAYLAAADTWVDRAEDTAVKWSELRDMMQKCRAAKKLMVLDACHSGAGKAAGGPENEADQISQAAVGEGMLTLASCRGSEKSWPLVGVAGYPDGRNSAYTHFLMKGLRGQADANHDGEVVLSELNRFVHDKVTDWARQRQLQQTPRMLGEVEGEISLAGRPQPGQLSLNAEPWAEISVDGQERGVTPRVLKDVAAGSHTISFRHPAYPEPIERQVTVRSAETLSLSVVFGKGK